MTDQHNQLRLRAAIRLHNLPKNQPRTPVRYDQLLASLDAVDAIAAYAAGFLIDRLRSKGYHNVADLFDQITIAAELEPPTTPKKPCSNKDPSSSTPSPSPSPSTASSPPPQKPGS